MHPAMTLLSKPIESSSTASTLATSGVGLFASIVTWLLGAFQWYVEHMPLITQWVVHLVQLGGVVIMIYTILILRRNWKSGSKSASAVKSE